VGRKLGVVPPIFECELGPHLTQCGQGRGLSACQVSSWFIQPFGHTSQTGQDRWTERSEIGCLPYFHTWCGLSTNLGYGSETCCTRLADNAGRKMSPKSRHLGTIVQLCRAISSQLRHVSTIGKKLVKQQYLLQMSPQYGELRSTSGWDQSGSLRHPCTFQRVSRLGSVTARHLVVGVSQTLRHWTEGATYVRQGDHHVGHWPTF